MIGSCAFVNRLGGIINIVIYCTNIYQNIFYPWPMVVFAIDEAALVTSFSKIGSVFLVLRTCEDHWKKFLIDATMITLSANHNGARTFWTNQKVARYHQLQNWPEWQLFLDHWAFWNWWSSFAFILFSDSCSVSKTFGSNVWYSKVTSRNSAMRSAQ